MFRARLASLTLAAGLLSLTGCSTGTGFRLFHRHSDCDCGSPCASPCASCGQSIVVGSASTFDGPLLVPDTSAPVVMPPASTTQPPRIVPVPQASPTPYQPTGLRKLFGQLP